MSCSENQYVLGTHDDELARLGLQHRAWQEGVLAAWHNAGISPGQTVLDIGCGPGYATLDLARLVESTGKVIALDKSERFLAALNSEASKLHHSNIVGHQVDFDRDAFPTLMADAAWCRWVFAFVRDPKKLLSLVAASIRPAGAIVIHEYFDYAAWRAIPPSSELEEFVTAVMRSWRDNGGEPDIARFEIPVGQSDFHTLLRCDIAVFGQLTHHVLNALPQRRDGARR